MPYLDDIPICIDYKYDFDRKRWYCEYYKLWKDSRIECMSCPHCKSKNGEVELL